MQDNVQLNKGQGGAVLRSLRDENGTQWPTATVAYAVSLADGANVLQEVTPETPLPTQIVEPVEIVQSSAANLKGVMEQGGEWVVGLQGGAQVAATQSGAWSVALAPGSNVGVTGTVATTVSGAVEVTQSDPANLRVTATLAAGSTIGLAPGSAVSVTGAVAVTQSGNWSLNEGTALIGKASAGMDGSVVYDGTTPLTPFFRPIAASASGANVIVEAVPGMRIRVLRWGLTAAGDVTAKWRSGSVDISGPRPMTKFASAGGAYCPVGVFETGVGEPLRLHLSEAVEVGGELTYVVVGAPS